MERQESQGSRRQRPSSAEYPSSGVISATGEGGNSGVGLGQFVGDEESLLRAMHSKTETVRVEAEAYLQQVCFVCGVAIITFLIR
jgi:hypothetical protein